MKKIITIACIMLLQLTATANPGKHPRKKKIVTKEICNHNVPPYLNAKILKLCKRMEHAEVVTNKEVLYTNHTEKTAYIDTMYYSPISLSKSLTRLDVTYNTFKKKPTDKKLTKEYRLLMRGGSMSVFTMTYDSRTNVYRLKYKWPEGSPTVKDKNNCLGDPKILMEKELSKAIDEMNKALDKKLVKKKILLAQSE